MRGLPLESNRVQHCIGRLLSHDMDCCRSRTESNSANTRVVRVHASCEKLEIQAALVSDEAILVG
jgi:hypothetical protein